ncbi:soluble quino protein glucose dehydrogenase [Bimuria novae-zelandiae CBS 107.79]|uniref:Soluble quino protein glucose dehydrogenase n=1 Tax=Bimuria novae-zelandiae CBS 107.79 TaxID=1447943 RepID=A0A6A5VD46_9PLEO|nr:soluble quino protein glucose dehydrogenase [Bimuria novae-zelandiae CBS 107.79]
MAALRSLLALAYIALGVQAQTSTASAAACASTIESQNPAPSVASGWRVDLVANNLTEPRGVIFDSEGGLLVVEQNRGISRITFNEDQGGCVRSEGSAELIIDDASLNHGIELSEDGNTLYASSPTEVYAWDYDASQGRNTSGPRVIIGEMGDTEGHTSRTLLLSRQVPGMLLVSRGSMSNVDLTTLDIGSGVSTIKAFNISNMTDSSSYNFIEDGLLLGWGLRNSVGVAEEPVTGGIYSVENSVDNFNRSGENIHQNNPGEEMNFHGYLNGTKTDEQGGNYGYPTCFAAWSVDEIPNNEGVQVGTQIAIGDQHSTLNDTVCSERVPPRLTFAAHQAPLDLKFNQNGTAAWITFHGSWNRDEPIGYKLSYIAFDGAGSPVANSTSNSSTVDIVSNPDLSRCPDECLRPVGLAWDFEGRLFMSSDSTGEIWVVTREDGGSAADASPSSGSPSPPSATEGAPAPSNTGAANVNVPSLTGAQFPVVLAGIMAAIF